MSRSGPTTVDGREGADAAGPSSVPVTAATIPPAASGEIGHFRQSTGVLPSVRKGGTTPAASPF